MLQGLHQKCRDNSCRPIDYPERILVPDDKVNWFAKWDEYDPQYCTLSINIARIIGNDFTPLDTTHDASARKIVLARKSTDLNILFDHNNRPLNPFGRTGLCGRGRFYNWGPNFTVDGVLWRIHNSTLQFVLIRRQTGELALPGGHIDADETPVMTVRRELSEEVTLDENRYLHLNVLYTGYVDDPRNTDNAWAETTAFMLYWHDDRKKPTGDMANFVPIAGDDAKEAMWVDFTLDLPDKLYASHGQILKSAVALLSEAGVVRLGNIAVK